MAALAGCGDDAGGSGGGGAGAPEALAFAGPGSLVSAEGRGSFRFGAATAATQIEDQNPNTDWWVWTAPESEGGLDHGNAFVGDASRGYTLALEDVGLLSATHLDSYRFSIEWARIEPQRDVIDEEALAHYDAVGSPGTELEFAL